MGEKAKANGKYGTIPSHVFAKALKAQSTRRTRTIKLVFELIRRLKFLDLLRLSCSPIDLFYTPSTVLHIDTPCLHTKPNIFFMDVYM